MHLYMRCLNCENEIITKPGLFPTCSCGAMELYENGPYVFQYDEIEGRLGMKMTFLEDEEPYWVSHPADIATAVDGRAVLHANDVRTKIMEKYPEQKDYLKKMRTYRLIMHDVFMKQSNLYVTAIEHEEYALAEQMLLHNAMFGVSTSDFDSIFACYQDIKHELDGQYWYGLFAILNGYNPDAAILTAKAQLNADVLRDLEDKALKLQLFDFHVLDIVCELRGMDYVGNQITEAMCSYLNLYETIKAEDAEFQVIGDTFFKKMEYVAQYGRRYIKGKGRIAAQLKALYQVIEFNLIYTENEQYRVQEALYEDITEDVLNEMMELEFQEVLTEKPLKIINKKKGCIAGFAVFTDRKMYITRITIPDSCIVQIINDYLLKRREQNCMQEEIYG